MMRHHLQQTGRVLCTVVGALLLLWTPISYFLYTGGQFPLLGVVGINFTAVSGVIESTVFERVPVGSPMLPFDSSFGCSQVTTLRSSLPPSTAADMMIRPTMFQFDRTVAQSGAYSAVQIGLPMVLIAAVFLIWPAISLTRRSLHMARRSTPTGTPAST